MREPTGSLFSLGCRHWVCHSLLQYCIMRTPTNYRWWSSSRLLVRRSISSSLNHKKYTMKRRRTADTTNRRSFTSGEVSLAFTFFQWLLISTIIAVFFFCNNVQPTFASARKSNPNISTVRRRMIASSSSSVQEEEEPESSSSSSISRTLRKRNVRLFSDDDSSNAINHHHSFSIDDDNSDGSDDDDDWGGDETTLILKCSFQHDDYPTVASILDWSFVEDMKLAFQDFLCHQSSLNIVHVHNVEDIKELREEGQQQQQQENENIITSLCYNKVFDPTSGQLLRPTSLLTDQYNETSHIQWIGLEMRYPIWKVGELFLEEAAAVNAAALSSGSNARYTGSDMMNEAARDAFETGIIDGTLETSLENWNITSSKISLHGKEYIFFGDGLLDTSSSSASGLEPIEHDANVLRAIGIVLLTIDLIAAFVLTFLAKQQRIEKEEQLRTAKEQKDTERTTSCLHTGLDEMLFASRQGIIAASSSTKSPLLADSSSSPQRHNRSRGSGVTPTKRQQQNDTSIEARSYRHLLVDDVRAIRSPSTAGFIMNPNRQLSTIFSEELVVSGSTSRRSGVDDTAKDHRSPQKQNTTTSSRRFSSESFPATTAASLAAASFPNKVLPHHKSPKVNK